MRVIDDELQGVMVTDEEHLYLRLIGPSITTEGGKLGNPNHVWYAMTNEGWLSVWNAFGQEEFERLDTEFNQERNMQ